MKYLKFFFTEFGSWHERLLIIAILILIPIAFGNAFFGWFSFL